MAWSKALSVAEVAGDRRRARPDRACPRARAQPHSSPQVGEVVERHRLDDRAALLVLELADVPVPPVLARSSSRAGCRSPPGAGAGRRRRAAPWLRLAARRQEPLEHRRLGLLGLEEQRVVVAAALEQGREGGQADAPDADDLERGVDELGSGRAGPDDPPGACRGSPPASTSTELGVSSAGWVMTGGWSTIRRRPSASTLGQLRQLVEGVVVVRPALTVAWRNGRARLST